MSPLDLCAELAHRDAPSVEIRNPNGNMANDVITSQIVLIVEDDLGDQELLRRAIEQCKLPVEVVAVNSGQRAIDLLHGRGEPQVEPDFAFVDLRLPGRGGLDVLRAIRAHPVLRNTITIVMTAAPRTEDIAQCYEAGANSVVIKPDHYDGYVEFIERFHDFWLRAARLPAR